VVVYSPYLISQYYGNAEIDNQQSARVSSFWCFW
jgi:hypothetical protein